MKSFKDRLRTAFRFYACLLAFIGAIFIGFYVTPAVGVIGAIGVGLFALNGLLSAQLISFRGARLCDNVIPAGLNLDVILDSALEAFRVTILPVTAFCTVFRDVMLKGTNKVSVPFYPLQSTASRDFTGTYLFDGTATELRDVTVNRRKYQSLAFTSEELNRLPALNPEQLGAMKGRKLAADVLADILSVVTAANFGAAIFTGAASGFDVDSVSDIETALTVANWPSVGRSLILDSNYNGNLRKDNPLLFANHSGDGGALLRTGQVEPIMGFDNYFSSNAIPANGEYLKGMAVFAGAILTAFSPIEPSASVRKNMTDYRTATDDSGLTLEYREWGDPDTDTDKRVIEVNYGFDLGDEEALKRIVSQ